jgi:hypothetical protein
MYGTDRKSMAARPVLTDADGVLLQTAGKYSDAALAGRLFYGSNQAAVATVTVLNTTWTGLALVNPTGNQKVFIVHEFSWALTVVGSAAGALSLAATTDSGMAASITPRCTRHGYAPTNAILDDGATVATAVIVKPIATYGTGAVTTWQGATQQVANLSGQIILVPGRSIITDTTTATTAAFIFGFLWEEVDLAKYV